MFQCRRRQCSYKPKHLDKVGNFHRYECACSCGWVGKLGMKYVFQSNCYAAYIREHEGYPWDVAALMAAKVYKKATPIGPPKEN